jgi:hypothetical protein
MVIQTRRESYHGLIVDEYVGPSNVHFEADLAIYAASWESRTMHHAEARTARSSRALILTFSDCNNHFNPLEVLSQQEGTASEAIDVGSHYKIQEAIELFLPTLFQNEGFLFGRVFVDVSCMPKYMSQYVLMELVNSKVVGEIIIGYTSGSYPHSNSETGVYDQGIDRYLTLPQTANVGISTRKGVIAALGADEKLIADYFTNEAGFDEHFLVAADGATNVAVDTKVRNQTNALAQKFQLPDESMRSVAPPSFLSCLDAYEDFISRNPRIDSWDIFCSGPKTHAIAACLAAMKHKTVKLIGRIPVQYDTTNVEAGETISLLRILDATSPAVSKIRDIRSPFSMPTS